MVPHKYQWIMHNRCLIVEADDDVADAPMPTLTFVPVLKLADHQNSSSTIDVLGCALTLLAPKQQNTRHGPAKIQELIFVDSSLQPIVFTMWNQFLKNEVPALSRVVDEKPIVAMLRVKVVTYNGISLSTISTSSLMIQPNIPEAMALQSWFKDNNDKVVDLMASKAFQAVAHINDQSVDEITDISMLPTLPDNTVFILKCKLSVDDQNQQFWYMSCSHCHRATSASYMEDFTCNYCKQKGVHGLSRCRVTVEASDSTGSITATIFGEDAEKLISCNAITLMKKEDLGHIACYSEDMFTLRVKATHSEFKGEMKRKFNIYFLETSGTPSKNTAVTSLNDRFLQQEAMERGKQKMHESDELGTT